MSHLNPAQIKTWAEVSTAIAQTRYEKNGIPIAEVANAIAESYDYEELYSLSTELTMIAHKKKGGEYENF